MTRTGYFALHALLLVLAVATLAALLIVLAPIPPELADLLRHLGATADPSDHAERIYLLGLPLDVRS